MIDSLHNVDENFYKIFLGPNMGDNHLHFRTHKGDIMHVPMRYFKKSDGRAEEDILEDYPVISITNFPPKLIAEWDIFVKHRIGGYKLNSSENRFTKALDIVEATPMEFRYELAVATKTESDCDAIKYLFYKNFYPSKARTPFFEFNKVTVTLDNSGPTTIADYVFYDFDMEDVPRNDGIFEFICIFVLKVWVNLVPAEEKDLLETVNIGLQTSDIIWPNQLINPEADQKSTNPQNNQSGVISTEITVQ